MKMALLPYLKRKRFEPLTKTSLFKEMEKKNIYIYIKHVFFSTVLITFVIQKFIFLKKEGKKEKERLDFLTNTPFERITRKLRV